MQIDFALIIFIFTYALIAVGHPPIFRIDRTGAALIGAALMIVFNVLDVDAAYRAVDYNTIILLFSLMIVVANLRLSGFFRLASVYVISHVTRPSTPLYEIVFMSVARHRVKIGFLEYMKVGAPVTIITLAVGAFWLTCA